MPSPADRFTRLQKVAIFLIALGAPRARQILAGVDLKTIEHLNQAIASLGPVNPEEKAAVMLEFADFFFEDKPLPEALPRPTPKKSASPLPRSQRVPLTRKPPPTEAVPPPKPQPRAAPSRKPPPRKEPHQEALPEQPAPAADESAVRDALQKLRERVDPDKIDWGRAGYDFGEGFKGPPQDRR